MSPIPATVRKDSIWNICLRGIALDAEQAKPTTTEWAEAEIRACCRLAALLNVPLVEAVENVVPVATTAGESVSRRKEWTSGRIFSA